jgi:adenylate kinase family enzyme
MLIAVGAGKSVLARALAEHFRAINLNVEDILHAELQTEFGKRVSIQFNYNLNLSDFGIIGE